MNRIVTTPHPPPSKIRRTRVIAAPVALVAGTLLSACGGTQSTPRASGFADTTISGPSAAATAPTTLTDNDAIRVAVCLQATDGTDGSTIAGARTALQGLSEVVDRWVPAEPAEDATRPGLELQVRPIVDHRLGSSFAQAPLIQAAVPALPAMPSVEANSAEGGVSAESQDRADRAGVQRAEAIAARSWKEQVQAASAALAPTSSNATELDLVGCAFAARDWLLRSPARTTALVMVTSGEVGLQDVPQNPHASAAGLSKIDHALMIGLCPTSDRCEYLSRSWGWFSKFFIGRDEPFVARDVSAGLQQLETTLNAGSQR